ncbi:restriction endonuclease subunit S [Thioalkalivibrio sp. ALJT]|uniref:restriction endonuclease subunit S n=1 Tax=Thioalkalivibrio sp. ALJT TaxID=1158146 RepID=UPI0012DE65CA|nr:restriction endonuclease subunit S [Thioalkalivibrio sp. ALJT]
MQTLARVSDGNHFTISDAFVDDGIPYYRGQDVTDRFFAETASPICITQEAYDRKYMRRSYLERGDVLLSIIGTIGELSLVASDDPATCSCKLAILRPRKIAPEFLAVFLRSEHGQNQIERLTRGAVQKGLILEDMEQLWVPDVSEGFEKRIAKVVQCARNAQEASGGKISEAEETLLEALGLADWSPPEPLSYSARASDAFAAGRLDAEHFRPKYARAMAHIAEAGVTITPLHDLIEPLRNGVDLREFTETGTPYIRVGDIKGGRIEVETAKRVSDSPASVKKSIHLKPGDILFTRKGSFGNAAVVSSEQTDAILSTEIMLLRLNARGQSEIVPDYLAAFFNSQLGKLQAEQWAHGVAFYSVTQDDLYKFQIPLPDKAIQQSISAQLDEADRLRYRSRETLEAAKRAVEITIEDGEDAAMALLDEAEGAD